MRHSSGSPGFPIMDEELYQSLSALMDDEVSELELESILSKIDSNTDLRNKWLEYNRVRDLLQGLSVSEKPLDISQKVRGSIENQSVDSQVKISKSAKNVGNPLVSFAVAAS